MKAEDDVTQGDLAYRQAIRYAQELRTLYRRERARDREDKETRDAQRRIQQVLENGEILPAFQPIVSLPDRELVGLEALARFRSAPERGPEEWFSEAAKVGLRESLELAAVRAAIDRFDEIPPSAYVALNLSPRTICAELDAILADVPSRRVVIEITEHAPVYDYAALRDSISGLRSDGARLAIDDAGAGFASLQHILRLEPDIIKLDISLTRHIDEDGGRKALARALITFAADIGATIVAEGVETAAELEMLERLGVRYAQGFYLGRPMSLEDLPRLGG